MTIVRGIRILALSASSAVKPCRALPPRFATDALKIFKSTGVIGRNGPPRVVVSKRAADSFAPTSCGCKIS